MILKPHTSYTVRQIKRPFFLAPVPTKDGCFVCAIGSRRGFPARLSILRNNSVCLNEANESQYYRHPLNVNDQLAFQEAKGIAGKTPVRFALKPHVPAYKQQGRIIHIVLKILYNTRCGNGDFGAFARVCNAQSRFSCCCSRTMNKKVVGGSVVAFRAALGRRRFYNAYVNQLSMLG